MIKIIPVINLFWSLQRLVFTLIIISCVGGEMISGPNSQGEYICLRPTLFWIYYLALI